MSNTRTTPPDDAHTDPIIQRLLDWLKTQIASLVTRTDETLATVRAVPGGQASAVVSSATGGAGTYHMTTAQILQASGTDYVSTTGWPTGLVALRAADYTVTGKTTQLRVVVITMTNGTDDTRTMTHGLYPFTHSGAAGAGAITLGTVVAGSTVAVNPTTNEERIDDSGWFTFPADGPYALGMVSSGAGAANSIRDMNVTLQVRNI